MKTKVFLCLCVAVGLLVQGAAANILWYNTPTNRISYGDGGGFLTGDRTDFTIGCFLQLIDAGTDQINNVASIFGKGVTGDDSVLAIAWVGMNVFGGDVNGWNNNGAASAGVSNQTYFVRAWSAPSSDYAQGYVPAASSNLYADTYLWRYPGPGSPPADVAYNFGGSLGYSTTMAPVPEPGLMGLMLAGLAGLAFARRRH